MAITDLGLLGTGSATTAATTLAVTNTTGAIIPAGTLIHITGTWDNIASITAPTITSSNVGSAPAVANHATAIGSGVTTTAGSGIWHQCFRVVTSSSIAIGATIATLTSNQSAVARAAHAEGWSGALATLRGTVATGTSTTGSPSAATAGTALVTGDLVIGSVSFENNAQMTADADTLNGTWDAIVGTFTVGGTAATNVGSGTQDKVVTATGVQTYNPTGGVADSVACVYAVLPAVVQTANLALTATSTLTATAVRTVLPTLVGGGPLVRTLKDSGILGAVTTAARVTGSSAAVTIGAGSLIVVTLGAVKSSANTAAFTATCTGLTLAQVTGSPAQQAAVSDKAIQEIWTVVDATGGSRTIAFDTTATNFVYGLFYEIWEYTGFDTATPLGATASLADNLTDGVKTMTLSAAPAATSDVIAVISEDTAAGTSTVDPGSTFTEIHEMDSVGSNFGVMETEARTGSTSTTVDWADVKAGASPTVFSTAGVAVEIRAGAGVPGGLTAVSTLTATATSTGPAQPVRNIHQTNTATVRSLTW